MTAPSVTPAASSPPVIEQRTLKSRLMGAGIWSASSVMLSHVLRLGGNLIVTRLLMPEMFGVMAIVLTISLILANLSDVGLHQSIIRHPRGNEPVFLNTVWSVQVVRGSLLWLVSIVIGLVVLAANALGWVPEASAYAHPALPWVLAVSGVGSVIHGLQSCKVHTAIRDLEMRRYVSLELAQQVVTLSMMILLAWLTRSIWAIVAANLIGEVVRTLGSYRILPGPRNHWAWDKGVLHDLLHFGKWLLLSSAIGIWAVNADRLMLAGYADATYMGLYSIALGLAGALSMVFEKLFTSVMMPAFSEMARKDPDRLPEVYFTARKRFDPIVLVGSGFLFAAGPLIIDVMYDDRYLGAGQILSILALGLLVQRYLLVHQVYLALNQPKYHAMLNAVRVVSTFTLIPLGLWLGGLTGGLLAIALRELPTLPLTFWLNARHGLNRFRLELGLLVFWVVGYGIGHGTKLLAAHWGLM